MQLSPCLELSPTVYTVPDISLRTDRSFRTEEETYQSKTTTYIYKNVPVAAEETVWTVYNVRRCQHFQVCNKGDVQGKIPTAHQRVWRHKNVILNFHELRHNSKCDLLNVTTRWQHVIELKDVKQLPLRFPTFDFIWLLFRHFFIALCQLFAVKEFKVIMLMFFVNTLL